MRIPKGDETWEALADPDGRLERDYPGTVIAVPRQIELDHENSILRWSVARGVDFRVARFETLADFVSLGEGSAQDVLQFARRWGVLALCDHLLPVSHNPLQAGRMSFGCEPLRDHRSFEEQGAWEFTWLWHHFALEARAILNVAIAARVEADVSHADMERAGLGVAEPRTDAEVAAQKILADDRWVLCGVNRWLVWGDVRPKLFSVPEPPPGEPGLVIAYGGASDAAGANEIPPECFRLFGALAIQLMQAVTSETLPAHCPGCKRVFERKRSNQRYCQACRRSGARSRRASKRLYYKKRSNSRGG